jgi:predicted NAD/FAD-dependent oxidoreductase
MNNHSCADKSKVVVIGAGVAGASCARLLRQAGHAVHLVDKSRGAGGRLASKRLEWTDSAGQAHRARVDHGAPGFAVDSMDFADFVAPLHASGLLLAWTPTQKHTGRPAQNPSPLLVPQPDMPSLCRSLLSDAPATWAFQVDRLQSGADGWQIEADGVALAQRYDMVVLAVPPAQAAPLLETHVPEWARQALAVGMEPCWTLLGVAKPPRTPIDWDLAEPAAGPLAKVIRADARPGRGAGAAQAHWVAHASADWSRAHLEQPASWVKAALETALDDCLGEAVTWEHAVVHRWRYARLDRDARGSSHLAADESPCWWHPTLRLGVCGDFLGGGDVEGAWRSAHALGATILSA